MTPGVAVDRRLFITSGLTGISLGAALPSMAEAATDPKPPKPRNRDDATKIIAEARRIVTPDGVERLETVKIGGIDQWVSVRGKDRRNPVVLQIHGGPGYISIPMSWWFSRDWESISRSCNGTSGPPARLTCWPIPPRSRAPCPRTDDRRRRGDGGLVA
jgi:hypothetical protein